MDKMDFQGKITGLAGKQEQQDINTRRDKSTGRGDNSSRSGSIQGRKMSVSAGVDVFLTANNAFKHPVDHAVASQGKGSLCN